MCPEALRVARGWPAHAGGYPAAHVEWPTSGQRSSVGTVSPTKTGLPVRRAWSGVGGRAMPSTVSYSAAPRMTVSPAGLTWMETRVREVAGSRSRAGGGLLPARRLHGACCGLCSRLRGRGVAGLGCREPGTGGRHAGPCTRVRAGVPEGWRSYGPSPLARHSA